MDDQHENDKKVNVEQTQASLAWFSFASV